jgi:hypothetical protein
MTKWRAMTRSVWTYVIVALVVVWTYFIWNHYHNSDAWGPTPNDPGAAIADEVTRVTVYLAVVIGFVVGLVLLAWRWWRIKPSGGDPTETRGDAT